MAIYLLVLAAKTQWQATEDLASDTNLLWADKPTGIGTGLGNNKDIPNMQAEIRIDEDETPEQKLARLEAENAALRQLLGKVPDDADYDNEAETVAEFVDDTSTGQSNEPVEGAGGLLNVVFCSENDEYKLTQSLEEHPTLREFSLDEYAAFKNAGWVNSLQTSRSFMEPTSSLLIDSGR